jgi:hypothetical protein
MKVRVTDEGVVVPREFLPGVEEVDIRAEGGIVLVVPAGAAEDPILGLGSAPVDCGAPDASERHDRYLYTPGE